MKILAAMSGGVDSSVSALLLKEQGHDVVGVTMKLWGGESDTGCCSVSDVEDARRTADAIQIDHFVFNFGEEFNEKVVNPYAKSHERGETPNPCIECNRHIKFQTLLERAESLGFDALATGHYARIIRDSSDESLWLARGASLEKDQSYVLSMLTPSQLEYILFPVGNMPKAEVRQIAEDRNLPSAQKPDSYEVCFIQKAEGRAKFLSNKIRFTPGAVEDASGNQLGTVPAMELITVGQRKGMGVSGNGEPLYVLQAERSSQKVIVGKKEDLLSRRQPLKDLYLRPGGQKIQMNIQSSAHSKAQPGEVVLPEENSGKEPHIEPYILWNEPQKRTAPGQSLVFYIGPEERVERVAGSATAK